MNTKKILLGITGSIAAYKSAELVRLLKQSGAEVRVVMTTAAQEFITPMTLSVLSEHRVYTDTFDQAAPMVHIELAKWADLILIAPASADLIARLAQGFANDLLTSICLATTAPVWIAPAMNQQMWQHPATQKNLQQLIQFNVQVLPTGDGEQACGDVGPGRMLEPEELHRAVKNFFQPKLIDYRVVITAGATQEFIDPVRYLTNQGSGKMGYALAEAFSQLGAEVILISGPTNLAKPRVHRLIQVKTADEMYQAVMQVISSCQIFIATASVVDYRVKNPSHKKIKKMDGALKLEFEQNVDILMEVSKLEDKPFIVGFAAETDQLLENATQKMLRKNCDMLIANQINEHGPFGADDNEVIVLQPNQEVIKFNKMSKALLAKQLAEFIIKCRAD